MRVVDRSFDDLFRGVGSIPLQPARRAVRSFSAGSELPISNAPSCADLIERVGHQGAGLLIGLVYPMGLAPSVSLKG